MVWGGIEKDFEQIMRAKIKSNHKGVEKDQSFQKWVGSSKLIIRTDDTVNKPKK